MADLNFPASPVDGQTYGEYTYVASKSVWQSIPGLPAGLLAGTIMAWGGSTAPDQWLICDGSAVSRSTYSALYSAVGTTYGNGNGTTTFNLPDLRGRVPVGSQTPTSLGTATITIAAPGVVTLNNHGLATGQIVYFTTTGALPTGITATTGRYWVVVTGSNTFNLATSLANATAGTVITTTGTQSGTHTVFSADFELGQSNGKVNHALKETEMPSHNHNFTYGGGENGTYPYTGSPNTSGGIAFSVGTSVFAAIGISSKGGNQPHLNVQPYETINYIIKYAAAYVPQESELRPRVDNLESGVTNYILNGGFDIWQRGAGPFSPGYTADRWTITVSGVSSTITQSTDVPNAVCPYSIRLVPAANGTETEYALRQVLERQQIQNLAGKQVTISCWIKSSKASVKIRSVAVGSGGTDLETNITVTPNTWTYISASFNSFLNLTSWTNALTGIGGYVDIGYANNQAITTGDTLFITGVQLQTGSTATHFRRNAPSIQAELAACQRYYQLNTSYYQPTGATAFSNGARTIVVNFPVQMRATPTSFAQNPLGGGSVFTQNGINKDGWLGYTTAGGEMYMIGYAASAEL